MLQQQGDVLYVQSTRRDQNISVGMAAMDEGAMLLLAGRAQQQCFQQAAAWCLSAVAREAEVPQVRST